MAELVQAQNNEREGALSMTQFSLRWFGGGVTEPVRREPDHPVKNKANQNSLLGLLKNKQILHKIFVNLEQLKIED